MIYEESEGAFELVVSGLLLILDAQASAVAVAIIRMIDEELVAPQDEAELDDA